MGRSVVRGKEAGQGEVIDFRRRIYCASKRCRGDDRVCEGWRIQRRRVGFYTSHMESFHLRVATANDIAAIRMLIEASVRVLQAPDYSEAQREGALATVFTVDSQLIADGTYFVAFSEDGKLAGCGGWSFRKTLYGGDHQVEKIAPERLDVAVDAAKIRAIFVHPDFARMGVGSLILAAAEEAAVAQGFKRFEMGSTLTGVALYTLKGYVEVERREVPVGSGATIEVVRMVKESHHLL
jgi:GNAT superfamily N-acetyltransferase